VAQPRLARHRRSGSDRRGDHRRLDRAHRVRTGGEVETSYLGIGLTIATLAIYQPLGLAKRRLGAKLGSAATVGEGTQNLLCGYLAIAVLAGLLANTLFGVWWLDPVVALAIAAVAVQEGQGVAW
jgi:divalent metal cation (Fe/Co/Zn/Cd) transporter